MPEKKRPKKGDWIRFRVDGRLVIGEVCYVRDSRYSFQGSWEAVTDQGDVIETSALEIRYA